MVNRPSVIWLTIDALRADHVGHLTQDRPSLTPHLDRFAEQSLVFEQAFAQSSYTRASFATLFTGTYPTVALAPGGGVSDENRVIAELFQSLGYETAAFNSNPFLSIAFGYHRGFDVFEDALFRWGRERLPERLEMLGARVVRLVGRQAYMPAPRLNRRVLRWFRNRDASRPFFAWIHYMDVHGPYQPKKGVAYVNKLQAEVLWRKAVTNPDRITDAELQRLRDDYQREIAYADGHIGGLLAELDRENVLDNSIVIITSDHGSEFREHGGFSTPRKLYDVHIHVPLLIRLPGCEMKGKVSALVGLIDIFPTILSVVGIPIPTTQSQGQSLVSDITGDADQERIFGDAAPDRDEPNICIRTRRWKFIYRGKERIELYDLENDSDEQENVVDRHAHTAAQLESQLLAEFASFADRAKRVDFTQTELDIEVLRRLQALGYIEFVEEASKERGSSE